MVIWTVLKIANGELRRDSLFAAIGRQGEYLDYDKYSVAEGRSAESLSAWRPVLEHRHAVKFADRRSPPFLTTGTAPKVPSLSAYGRTLTVTALEADDDHGVVGHARISAREVAMHSPRGATRCGTGARDASLFIDPAGESRLRYVRRGSVLQSSSVFSRYARSLALAHCGDRGDSRDNAIAKHNSRNTKASSVRDDGRVVALPLRSRSKQDRNGGD